MGRENLIYSDKTSGNLYNDQRTHPREIVHGKAYYHNITIIIPKYFWLYKCIGVQKIEWNY